jgi:hypothetical protein
MSQIASIYSASCLRARAGAFVLPAAQALALRPKEASCIRITCGSAWITMDDGVDYFLAADECITVPASSRVVMESMKQIGQLKFDWQPLPQVQRERRQLRGHADALAAEDSVSPFAQSSRDLRGAAVLAARGLVGLVTALAAGLTRGLGAGLRTGFGEVLTGGLAARARNAHSSARAAQGRMASCESIASSGAA